MALDATAEDTHYHQHREIRSIYVKPKGVVFTQLLQTEARLSVLSGFSGTSLSKAEFS